MNRDERKQANPRRRPSVPALALAVCVMLALSGCLTLGDSPAARPTPGARTTRTIPVRDHTPTPQGREVVMYALGLIGVDYRFGGQNPEAGLDCSGMVRYIYRQAARQEVRGSAADIARQGQRVASEELRPGDLVFFNTRNRPHSHVGIYIGEGRFIHAPSSNGKVRIDALNTRYYAERFEEGRTYF